MSILSLSLTVAVVGLTEHPHWGLGGHFSSSFPPNLRGALLSVSLRKQGERWNEVNPGCGSKWIMEIRQTNESHAATPI